MGLTATGYIFFIVTNLNKKLYSYINILYIIFIRTDIIIYNIINLKLSKIIKLLLISFMIIYRIF